MTAPHTHEAVLIVDFGSQVTQLIARRLREAGVYCEIHPFNKAGEALKAVSPKAIILSGGPNSTTDADSPRADHALFEAGVPVLGICYGEQAICAQLGGKVESGHHREFGRAEIVIARESPLFAGIGAVDHREPVWMSHGDRVTAIPPGFEVIATSEGAPFAAVADETRKIYGVQFHPEVMHTPRGATLLKNFTHGIAGLTGDWTMAAYRDEQIDRKSTRLNSSHVKISYAVFCLKKKNNIQQKLRAIISNKVWRQKLQSKTACNPIASKAFKCNSNTSIRVVEEQSLQISDAALFL